MTIDATHIYWGSAHGIGRANLDGTSPEPTFIPGVGTVFLGFGLAVDSSHIYWGNGNTRAIGRANLDGSAPNPDFITGIDFTTGPAVNASHIYWGDYLPPRYGKTVEVKRVRGKVLVKERGTGGFAALKGLKQIPVGSTIDTSGGRVRLLSAKARTGTSDQTADFYGGTFKIRQPKKGKPITELDLVSSARSRAARVLARRHHRNGLWGSGRGNYLSKGKHGSATVRGTIWFTEDRTGGTLFKVRKGVVKVKDFTRHRKVTLKKGQRYLAPARR